MNHPLFYRVSQVASGYGGGRVAKCVGDIGLGRVEAAHGVFLQFHAVEEGLAAIVHGPAAGFVGASQAVNEGNRTPAEAEPSGCVFVLDGEGFVANLMVVDCELPEITTRAVPNHG